MRILTTLAVFLGAFLLFLVQPLAGKLALPVFGGTPAVWSATMLFFQTALLAGYAYAHYAGRMLGIRRHAIVHVVLLLVAGLTLPITLRRAGEEPSALVVGATLALSVGLPFFVLSATAPLLQRWFGESRDPAAHNPYVLYAASNLGSMLALLAYPFLIEPRFAVGAQRVGWSVGYAALGLLIALSAFILLRSAPAAQETPGPEATAGPEVAGGPEAFGAAAEDPGLAASEPDPKPDMPQILRWILLAAAPSGLILAATSHLTINVAPVPLLWVVPLALYLLTFILAFSDRVNVPSWITRPLVPFVLFPVSITLVNEQTGPVLLVSLIHLGAFFITALCCHAVLAETKPSKKYLTDFYLYLSLGGALGGAFVSLVAPAVFNSYAEYPILMVAACLAAGWGSVERGWNKWDALLPAAAFIGIVLTRYVDAYNPTFLGQRLSVSSEAWIFAAGALLMISAIRVSRYGLALAGLFVAAALVPKDSYNQILYRDRTFFGTHQVELSRDGETMRLIHGNTLHGVQLQDPKLRNEPTSYYSRTGPIGRIITALQVAMPYDAAFVGLGTGTLAAYGQPGQTIHFYEIDPTIERIARNPRFFTYLRDSQAEVRVILGDARLKLAEADRGRYGLIALDAFSSDAIPVHLLTREAFAMYRDKLREDGVIAVHISNRYLDLKGPVAATARSLGLQAWVIHDAELSDEDRDRGKFASEWIALARRKEHFRGLPKAGIGEALEPSPTDRPWTDDYSNILAALIR